VTRTRRTAIAIGTVFLALGMHAGIADAATSYTARDVAKHATAKSCWSSINGNVYDLTKWVKRHPGGSRIILAICGKDASRAFNAQHASGPKPAAALAPFKIGVLRK
jgi:cytochrome b involved in lipid metabolism